MKKNILNQTGNQYFKNINQKVPRKNEVHFLIESLLSDLFPILAESSGKDGIKNPENWMQLLESMLKSFDYSLEDSHEIIHRLISQIPDLYEKLKKDAIAIHEGDPAANSVEEVIICYPGFYAIVLYRIAHELDKLSIPIIPRMVTEYSHSKTGIDIHPKAIIGDSFCIDHGTGIVIGETAVIGDSVKIYQGVTLGALSVSKINAGKKRHPTIEKNTIIYAGSTILGGNTTIGYNSIIGGNVWLTQSVEPYSIVINQIKFQLKNNNPNREEEINFQI